MLLNEVKLRVRRLEGEEIWGPDKVDALIVGGVVLVGEHNGHPFGGCEAEPFGQRVGPSVHIPGLQIEAVEADKLHDPVVGQRFCHFVGVGVQRLRTDRVVIRGLEKGITGDAAVLHVSGQQRDGAWLAYGQLQELSSVYAAYLLVVLDYVDQVVN